MSIPNCCDYLGAEIMFLQGSVQMTMSLWWSFFLWMIFSILAILFPVFPFGAELCLLFSLCQISEGVLCNSSYFYSSILFDISNLLMKESSFKLQVSSLLLEKLDTIQLVSFWRVVSLKYLMYYLADINTK